MQDEQSIREMAQVMAEMVQAIENWRLQGYTPAEINYQVARASMEADAEIATADFYIGIYRGLSWVLGLRSGITDDDHEWLNDLGIDPQQ